jgi:hypothetical protein
VEVIGMKTLQGKIGVFLLMIGISLLGVSEVWGVNWKLYAFNVEETFFYDAASLISPSEGHGRGIVRVWIREDFTNKS